MENRAVVLLSGGLDSTTCLAMAQAQGREIYALTVLYGQRHAAELEAANRIANRFKLCEHRVVSVDLGQFGGSALTSEIPVPKGEDVTQGGVPITYVPARNTIFLSLALAWAEVLKASEIWIGVNSVDYSGYPDCRPEFLEAFQSLAQLATKAGVEEGHSPKVVAPLLEWSKFRIIQEGVKLGVPYEQTSTCYDPDNLGRACGSCDACNLRRQGFLEAGIQDPTRYSC
jgi:7-cyano-7-deazaguanine synthase